MEGVVDVAEELAKARGFSISTNDFLLREGEGGAPALFESSIPTVMGLTPVVVAQSSTFDLSGISRVAEGLTNVYNFDLKREKSVYFE